MMHFRKFFAVIILLLSIAAPCRAEQKIRVAVLKFSDAGSGHVSGHLGRATEGWFVDSLVNAGKFQVLEREQLNAILKEQRFQSSGDVSQATAVKAGKIAGVQVVVFGNVHFAQKKQELHTSGWLPGVPIRLPSGGGSKRTSEGNLTVRAVNVQSGEILFSKTETLSESNFKISIMGTGGGTVWDETVFRKIYQPAVDKVTDEMIAKIDTMRDGIGSTAASEGKVVSLKPGVIFINLGKLDGVKPGDKFEIFEGENIIDPDTKEVLGRDEKLLGTVVLEKLSGDHLSTTKILSGSGFAKGNIAKKK